jgi:hypothetical protein
MELVADHRVRRTPLGRPPCPLRVVHEGVRAELLLLLVAEQSGTASVGAANFILSVTPERTKMAMADHDHDAEQERDSPAPCEKRLPIERAFEHKEYCS